MEIKFAQSPENPKAVLLFAREVLPLADFRFIQGDIPSNKHIDMRGTELFMQFHGVDFSQFSFQGMEKAEVDKIQLSYEYMRDPVHVADAINARKKAA